MFFYGGYPGGQTFSNSWRPLSLLNIVSIYKFSESFLEIIRNYYTKRSGF